MQILLTHEQADFDAVAALLGAWLVNEGGIPIQPRRCNRNVSAFLTLYGQELPFTDPRDLSPGSVDSILVVDTQYPVTLKGTHAGTSYAIVDHHPKRTDAPPGWSFTIDLIGATTTLFVETVQEMGAPLTAIQATLMLLGIYEDTGSLTYSNTTPRDIRAAAFLVEQGASLALLGRYLNPPLSDDQRRVYDRLLASAESLQVNGQKIVIACASAEDMHEEVSSVAHKLRDLLEPDGLFMFVTTGEGIRMVARSSTSRIDVNAIAGEFGGGGHERAAAALIRTEARSPEEKGGQLAEQCSRLKEILPRQVKPSITVAQMMSRRPRLISPETSAEEAAVLMQHYGYEGYPVIRDGKVVGLLTRRAVDRAISHRLNLNAGSLMEAGEVTVSPGDSIDRLQQVMIASGWGQIPVVDPESSAVIGIVTRTDLIKTLAIPTHLDTRQNLSIRLEKALPPARLNLLRLVAQEAHSLHQAVYIVGGFVRDLLMERPSQDLDIVIEGDAIHLAQVLQSRYGGEVISHSKFGTAKWTISEAQEALLGQLRGEDGSGYLSLPEVLDLISARTEFYEHPTALPTVERGSIKLDLHRRDFTINTMALRLDGRHYGELYDFWGGLNDLQARRIRVLHSLSFIEDPTRLLRAVRFEQRFGFKIEDRTLQLVGEACPMLRQVSGDRIRHEIELILEEPRAEKMLARLNELGILPGIHPDLPGSFQRMSAKDLLSWRLAPQYGGIRTTRLMDYLIWLAPLDAVQIRSVSDRLRFSRNLQAYLLKSIDLRQAVDSLSARAPSQAAAMLDAFPLPVLLAAYQICREKPIRDLLLTYATRWRHIQPTADGETLKGMGVPPGPRYRSILSALKKAWIDGEIQSPEQEKTYIQGLLEKK